MKKFIIIILMFVLSLKQAVAQNPTKVFINVDKSLSMPSSSIKQDKHLTKVVKMHTKNSNTVIFEVKFINGATSSTSNSKVFIYKESEYKDSNDDKLQKILYQNKIKRKRKSVAKRIVSFIKEYKSQAKFTNIVSSIIPISKVQSSDVYVYYYTDGVESSRELRMLDLKPFKTAKIAVESARKDIKVLHTLYNLPKELKGVKNVQFILPVQMEREVKGGAFIEEYFTEIFRLFNVNQVQFKTL
ncbi:MAG: hypothetical protein JXR05_16540 [Flavobacteriaceae bacterium]